MREDFLDAEQEPVPAPIDLCGQKPHINLRKPVALDPVQIKTKLKLR